MKIKIIELLNRIANGEEVPKKFVFYNKIFELQVNETSPKNYYYMEEGGNYTFKTYISDLETHLLNREVEIIEEDKTIKELKTEYKEKERYIYGISGNKYSMRVIDCIFSRKINELVKEINKLKEN